MDSLRRTREAGKNYLDILGGTREAGKDHFDSLGGTREAGIDQWDSLRGIREAGDTNRTACEEVRGIREAPGRQERTISTAWEALGGRKRPMGQPARH